MKQEPLIRLKAPFVFKLGSSLGVIAIVDPNKELVAVMYIVVKIRFAFERSGF